MPRPILVKAKNDGHVTVPVLEIDKISLHALKNYKTKCFKVKISAVLPAISQHQAQLITDGSWGNRIDAADHVTCFVQSIGPGGKPFHLNANNFDI